LNKKKRLGGVFLKKNLKTISESSVYRLRLRRSLVVKNQNELVSFRTGRDDACHGLNQHSVRQVSH